MQNGTEDKKSKPIKSKAKAAGVKSTFKLNDNQVLVTSFGKGNDAIIEKMIVNDTVQSINDPKKFDVEVSEYNYNINNTAVKDAKVNKLQKSNTNILHEKEILEEKFYGRTFDDNIHIQVIYNILDIKKIFVPHINNILVSLNSLARTPENRDYNDYVGRLKSNMEYSENIKNNFNSFLELATPRLSYFPDIFMHMEKVVTKSNGKAKVKFEYKLNSERDIYNTLRLVSAIRQGLMHPEKIGNSKKADDYILSIDSLIDNQLKELLDRTYDAKVNEINNNFIKLNKKAKLPLVFEIYYAQTDDEKKKLTCLYYEYIIKKENKNLGFSIKTLREKILESDNAQYIKNKEYDSVRHNIYTLMDFVLFKYYKDNPKQVEGMVSQLRSSLTDADKENIYYDEAKVVWQKINYIVNQIIVKKNSQSEIEKIIPAKVENEWIDSVKISTSTTSYFSKMVYFISRFLDGKEINDLITTLINKFENIDSFNTVLADEIMPHEEQKAENKAPIKGLAALSDFFTDDNELLEEYSMFKKSYTIANELRIVKSFSRMVNELPAISEAMYIDAANILGIKKNNIFIDAQKEDIEEKFFIKLEDGSKDTNLRNFIINNVIKSSRFRYIIRYTDAITAKKISENKRLVEFALRQLSRDSMTQIDRYIESLKLTNQCNSDDEKIILLAKRISEVDLSQLEKIKQKVKINSKEAIKKEQMKAIVSLYLLVVYQIVKNMVNINARYVIAFYSVVQDKTYHSKTEGYMVGFNKWLVVTKLFIDKKWLKEPPLNYISQNLCFYCNGNTNTYEAAIIEKYRNNVAHLSVIDALIKYSKDMSSIGSYYALYQYCIQRTIYENHIIVGSEEPEKVSEKIHEMFESIIEHQSYSKDLVKCLNLPFAYNLARYKNLSIECLFDKNDYDTKNETVKLK